MYEVQILSILHLKQYNVHDCQQIPTRKYKKIWHYIFIYVHNTMANILNSLIVSCFLFPGYRLMGPVYEWINDCLLYYEINAHKKLINNAALIPKKCYVYMFLYEWYNCKTSLFIFLIYIDLVFMYLWSNLNVLMNVLTF